MPSASHSALKNIPKRLRSAATPRVVFGDVVYEPGGTCGPRVQADFQLVVLLEGEVTAEVEGRAIVLRAGQVGLFRPGRKEHFRFTPKRKSRHTWCAVQPACVEAALAAACTAVSEVLPVTRRFAQLMELGLSLPRAGVARAQGLIEVLGLAALQEYVYTGQGAPGAAAAEPDALRRALEWVEQSGHEPVDLRGLARVAGVSPAQLVMLFRRYLGTTPIRHVWEARTRRGGQLLRETGLTVSEIAFQCGFQTPFHFSRWAKELFGASPRTLRKRAWLA